MYDYKLAHENGLYRIEVSRGGIPKCTYNNATSWDMSQIVQSPEHPNPSYRYLCEDLDGALLDLKNNPDFQDLDSRIYSLCGDTAKHEEEINHLKLKIAKLEEALELGLAPSDIRFMEEELECGTKEEVDYTKNPPRPAGDDYDDLPF